jgi:hypothetical protein
VSVYMYGVQTETYVGCDPSSASFAPSGLSGSTIQMSFPMRTKPGGSNGSEEFMIDERSFRFLEVFELGHRPYISE